MTTASRVRLRLAGDDRLVASVRRGDAAAFEAMYDRHSAELLSFCVYMLGSRHDAEDAVQATFASAYRALRADRRSVSLRPWLFTIARNDCLSILRRRRPWVELNGEQALNGDPLRELELREEVRQMIEGLRALPESQRASLVLAELHGFSQAEIGTVLGVQAEQVKAFICQARSNLVSDRTARETDCGEIREELASARGAALLRGRLRRHLRSCDDCRTYADGVARQRRHLGVLLPLGPSLLLKYRALEDAFGSGVAADPASYAGGAAAGGSVAGAAAEVAGGGLKALVLKIAAGVAFIGAGAGAGASVLVSPGTSASTAAPSALAAVPGPAAQGSAAAHEHARGEGRSGSLSSSQLLRAGAGGEAGGRRSGAPGSSGAALSRGSAEEGGSEAERRQRHEERELRGEEQQRRAEEEHRREREQRPPGPTAQSLAARQRVRAERLATTQPRVAKSESERQRSEEERIAARDSKPPKSTKEERQRAREERQPERASRPPKSEAERERAREERLRRREEKRTEAPGG